MTRTAVIAIALLCCLPTAAHAATVTGERLLKEEGSRGLPDYYEVDVRFQGEPGEASDVTVTIKGARVVFEEVGGQIEAHGACTREEPDRVACPSGDDPLGFVHVFLGDGPDTARIDSDDRSVLVRGGPGDDVIHGGDQSDRLFGGPGDDLIDGGRGGDTIDGGGGRDELRAGELDPFMTDIIEDGDGDGSADSDTIIGNPSLTYVSYGARRSPIRVDLDAGTAGAAGERDRLIGINQVGAGRGDDTLLGSRAGDFLRGNDGADVIRGRGGDDLLWGERGRDRVYGGAGDDTAGGDSDDARDVHNCGPGADSVGVSDARDRLRRSCEDGAWSAAPDLGEANRITAHPTLSRKVAVFRSTCREHPKCSGRIRLKAAGSRRLLGRGSFEFRQYRGNNPENAPRHEIVARLNKRGRNWLRRGGYVRVVIVSQYDCGGCLNPSPPAKTGFTTYMRR